MGSVYKMGMRISLFIGILVVATSLVAIEAEGCFDEVRFKLVCRDGYEGQDCTDINECDLGSNPCQNGGLCVNQPGTFSCNCTENFMGDRCEIIRGPCEWGPWSPCDKPCGIGETFRTRTGVSGGPCPGPNKEVVYCNTHECPRW